MALMALFLINTKKIPSTALALNIVVTGIAVYNLYRKEAINLSLIIPFLVTSIPASFAGGLIELDPVFVKGILGATLFPAGVLLWIPEHSGDVDSSEEENRSVWISALIGGGIGFLAGITGIGGGVFLIPIVLLTGYARAGETTGLAAVYVFVNSVSAFSAHAYRLNVYFRLLGPLVVAVSTAAVLGTWINTEKLSSRGIRRMAGVVLMLASIQLCLGLFGFLPSA